MKACLPSGSTHKSLTNNSKDSERQRKRKASDGEPRRRLPISDSQSAKQSLLESDKGQAKETTELDTTRYSSRDKGKWREQSPTHQSDILQIEPTAGGQKRRRSKPHPVFHWKPLLTMLYSHIRSSWFRIRAPITSDRYFLSIKYTAVRLGEPWNHHICPMVQ